MAKLSFRSFLTQLQNEGKILRAKKPLSRRLEASAFLKASEETPVQFQIKESMMRIAGNLCATRELVASSLNIPAARVVPTLLHAIENPTKPRVVEAAPCFEVVEEDVDLDRLPILFHCELDGGNYVTAGVVVAHQNALGQNVSFHRLMQIGKDEFAIRIVPRHLQALLDKNGGELPVAVCIGNSIPVLLSGACSVEQSLNELEIANTLQATDVVKCEEANCTIPAETEIVLVGRITREVHDEGPFVDLTETYDIVRKQNILKIERIYHRRDPIYHALLPGGLEHKLLMGMPREATILREVSRVAECLDVSLTRGGCSWLHGVVKIQKRNPDDGFAAIKAAFEGHPSMKHVIIVDDDIDISNMEEVEWAVATRLQGDKGIVIKQHEKGSSLDPSADPVTRETTKVGFDATKPLIIKGKNFQKAKYPTLS